MRFKDMIVAIGFVLAFGQPALADKIEEYVEAYCASEGMDGGQCACAKGTFADGTSDLDEGQSIAMAFFLGQPGLTPQQAQEGVLSIDQSQLPTAMMALSPLLDEITSNCSGPMETDFVDDPSLSPRERYVAICEMDIDLPEVCDCVAGSMEDRLDPLVFELLVDVKAEEAAGNENAFETIAEERGLSSEEAEEVLSLYSASLMSTVGIVMACVPAEMQQMIQGGLSGVPAQ